MDIKFNLTEHKKLWNWLAEHPEMRKIDYFDTMELPIPDSGCYACDYTRKYTDKLKLDLFCEYCPLKQKSTPFCLGGLFDEWEDAQEMLRFALTVEEENIARERIRKAARKIANLSVREGVECI